MSSKSGHRSRSRSRDSHRSSSRKREDRPWLRRSNSRSKSHSRSRSPRKRRVSDRVSRSRSRSPISFSRPVMSREPKYANSRVFVANLASDKVSASELKEIFDKHGEVLGGYFTVASNFKK